MSCRGDIYSQEMLNLLRALPTSGLLAHSQITCTLLHFNTSFTIYDGRRDEEEAGRRDEEEAGRRDEEQAGKSHSWLGWCWYWHIPKLPISLIFFDDLIEVTGRRLENQRLGNEKNRQTLHHWCSAVEKDLTKYTPSLTSRMLSSTNSHQPSLIA